MKCKNCGAEIPKGFVYCEKCGAEVQIVPDYNPLDDVLTAQVRGALREEPSENMKRKIPIHNVTNSNGMISYTLNIPLSKLMGEEAEDTFEEEPEQRRGKRSDKKTNKMPVRKPERKSERKPVNTFEPKTEERRERTYRERPVSRQALLREEKHQQERERKRQAILEKRRQEKRKKC